MIDWIRFDSFVDGIIYDVDIASLYRAGQRKTSTHFLRHFGTRSLKTFFVRLRECHYQVNVAV